MRRRTLKRYTELYRDPTAMFPGDVKTKSKPVDVILYPNGQREIWLKSQDGTRGFRIEVSDGPHGLGLRVGTFVGGAGCSVIPYTLDGTETLDKARHVEICQYQDTPTAHAYARWYRHQETELDLLLLGPEYKRTNRHHETDPNTGEKRS